MTTDHLHKAVVKQMKAEGLTAYALAKKARIAPNTMRRFETGETNLRSDHLARVCSILGLKLVVTK